MKLQRFMFNLFEHIFPLIEINASSSIEEDLI